MICRTRKTVAAGLLAASAVIGGISRTEAAPIDCAILLCLSGNWPSSAECSAARAEFIRRITPFPIEPPLQIWRCPMGASYSPKQPASPVERLYDAAISDSEAPAELRLQPGTAELPSLTNGEPRTVRFPATLRQLKQDGAPPSGMLELAGDYSTENGRADIDISDRAFDFVRSIRVYHVKFEARKEKDYCGEIDSTQVGTYGVQGGFSWRGYSARGVPSYVMPPVKGCPEGSRIRAVGVEWKDYEGNTGSELIYY